MQLLLLIFCLVGLRYPDHLATPYLDLCPPTEDIEPPILLKKWQFPSEQVCSAAYGTLKAEIDILDQAIPEAMTGWRWVQLRECRQEAELALMIWYHCWNLTRPTTTHDTYIWSAEELQILLSPEDFAAGRLPLPFSWRIP